MNMPRTGEAHRKLQALIGCWSGQEQLHPSPWDPAGGPAQCEVENRLALDGFAVIHDYTQRRDGRVNFQGHGVFRYDANEDVYQLHWFDSLGQAPSTFRGTFEESRLRLQCSFGEATRAQPGMSARRARSNTGWRSPVTAKSGSLFLVAVFSEVTYRRS